MKVFMSHSSVDKLFVERLAGDLRVKENLDAWLDKWEIFPGDSIPAKLEEGLKSASVLIFVLSPNSIDSVWAGHEKDAWLTAQINEEKLAREESRAPNRRLIPVLYRDCEKPFFLEAIKHVSINDQNYDNGFRELVQGIRRESSRPPLRDDSNAVPIPPLPQQEIQSSVIPRKLAFDLLKVLISSQFELVIFEYGIDKALLPKNVAQVQEAIAVIDLAQQKQGETVKGLIETIYRLFPYLKSSTPIQPSDDLSFEKGIDYTRLCNLLADRNWEEADYETYLVMLKVVGRKDGDWIRDEELLNFPCTDLHTIDRLWVRYSTGRFGFSVQKKIYFIVSGMPDGEYHEEAWEKFGDRVGWRKGPSMNKEWIGYSEVTFNTSAPVGHLPTGGGVWVWGLLVGCRVEEGRKVGVRPLWKLVNCNL